MFFKVLSAWKCLYFMLEKLHKITSWFLVLTNGHRFIFLSSYLNVIKIYCPLSFCTKIDMLALGKTQLGLELFSLSSDNFSSNSSLLISTYSRIPYKTGGNLTFFGSFSRPPFALPNKQNILPTFTFFPLTNFKKGPTYTLIRSSRVVLKNGILLPKLFWPTVRKNCSSDWEKLLKFEAEG